ncbi:MAG: hypothetical protein ABI175_27655, partial [Polyangiales bacterium]
MTLALFTLAGCAVSGPDSTEEPGVKAELLVPSSAETCPGEDAETAEARLSIARIRAMAGLPGLRCDGAAMAAATKHCGYIVANHELTHEETPGRPAFFAVSFDQR